MTEKKTKALAANSEKTGKKPRGPGKKFAKGVSGNPSGRPARTPEEMDLIAACKERTSAALAVIESIMMEGENERNRLSAAQAIIERAHGKPVQPTELSGKNGGALEITQIQRTIVDPKK
jgi:hypothetical protein